MRRLCAACRAAVVLAGVLLSTAPTARAEKPATEGTGKRIYSDVVPATGTTLPQLAPFDELMTEFLLEHQIPGAALAVTKGGRLVYARGFGYGDVEAQTLVRPLSLFRIASVSKPITAAAVLQLVDRGKLKLDDAIFDVLALDARVPPGASPDPRWRRVTIEQLLQHTGGWDRDKSPDPMTFSVEAARFAHAKPPASADAIIRLMLTKPLDFDPGRRNAYSNFGYCLLGRAIEAASGQSYGAYVREQVLAPLGISRMRIGRSRLGGRLPDEVRYYAEPDETTESIFARDLGQPVPVPYGGLNMAAMDSHGGWVASAVDLVRFASAFDEHTAHPLLSPGSRGHLFEPPPGPIGHRKDGRTRNSYYACGWCMTRDGDGFNSWHNGHLDGTSTLLVRRHDGVTWAALFNSSREVAKDRLPGDAIDGKLHEAADRVESWPDGDLFPLFLGDTAEGTS